MGDEEEREESEEEEVGVGVAFGGRECHCCGGGM